MSQGHTYQDLYRKNITEKNENKQYKSKNITIVECFCRSIEYQKRRSSEQYIQQHNVINNLYIALLS